MKNWFVKYNYIIYIIYNIYFIQRCCFPNKKEELSLNDKVAEVQDNQNNANSYNKLSII